MTLLTGGELEILMGLRVSWGRLYSKEITRLRSEDDSKHAADCGVDLTDGLANRDEGGVIRALDEVSTSVALNDFKLEALFASRLPASRADPPNQESTLVRLKDPNCR
jgi:hypothetical protein